MKQRWSSLLLCAAMLFSLCMPASAAEGDVSFLYCDESGKNWKPGTCSTYKAVTDDTDEWENDWYVAEGTVNIGIHVHVRGNVHLILKDGCELDAESGISLDEGASLTIYAQSDGETMGKLTARCSGSSNAGINVNSGSTITINGGEVTAYGSGGAGIGGYSEKAGGQITINGGTVNARSDNGAGIGGGKGMSGGTVTINGGTVTATSNYGGAGIGGGGIGGGAGGTITITGGVVTATGNTGAGIGGGYDGAGGKITISGGTVTASSNSGGAGIGGGSKSGDGGTFSTGTNGSAFITASSIEDTSNQGSWQGIFFADGSSGQVYGNPTLTTDMTIPVGKDLNIPSETSLTIGEGATLNNNSLISGTGTFKIEGTLENDGTIMSNFAVNNGTINNKNTIIIPELLTNNGTLNNIGGTIDNSGKIDNTNGIIISNSEIEGEIKGNLVHIHQWEAEWSSNSTHHWHECPDCPLDDSQKDAYADHTFGEWTTDTEATADTAGSKSRTCNICQYTETQTIPATGGGSSGGSSGGSWGGYIPPTYKPDVTQPSQGGGVSVSTSNPKQGDTVTVTPEPDQGYEVDEVAVTGPDGRPVEVKRNPDGTFSFTQPAGKVKIEVTYKAAETPWNNPFADVDGGGWYYEAVRFVQERGLMNGYSDGRFGPNDTLSRAQLAQILFNKEGRPGVNYLLTFSDVAGEAWYTAAIRWAASQGIVSGYGNGTFGPNDPITREQLAVMLWRYSGSPAAVNKELHFNDESEISPFALEAMRWAVENGILNGYGGGRLDPQGQATRAEAAQMLKNFIENQEATT